MNYKGTEIGVQLYTIRDHAKTPEEIKVAFERCKKMGFNCAQVSGIGEIDSKELAKIAKDNDVVVPCTHTSYDRMMNDLDALAKEHLDYGCKVMGVSYMPHEFERSYDGFVKFSQRLNEIGEKLKPYGMKVAYHNHDFEFVKYNGKIGMDIIIENTNPETVEFILDIYWIHSGACSIVDYIKKVEGRMSTVHLKDMKMVAEHQHEMTSIGDGNFNFVEILDTCAKTGVKFAVIEQDICPKDSFECLLDSYNYLATICK